MKVKTSMNTTLEAGAPFYDNFTTVPEVPYKSETAMRKINNPVHDDKKEIPLGFVPLYTSQLGSLEFNQPNTDSLKLSITIPKGKVLDFDTLEEVVPQTLKYEFQKGIRPEIRALLSIP